MSDDRELARLRRGRLSSSPPRPSHAVVADDICSGGTRSRSSARRSMPLDRRSHERAESTRMDRDRRPAARRTSTTASEEYDNPLPGWWVVDLRRDHRLLGRVLALLPDRPGPDGHRAVRRRDARGRRAPGRARAAAEPAPATDIAARPGPTTPASSRARAEIFATHCASCHGPEGRAHRAQPHGRLLAPRAARSPRSGTPSATACRTRGCVPWKDQLQPDEISALAAYVAHAARHQPAEAQAAAGRERQGRSRPGDGGDPT